MGNFFEFLFAGVPLIFGAFIIRWLRILRINSEKQIEQNKEIIALLKSDAPTKEGRLYE